jgi:alkanesulfonate monooxygenase SsuD/methylene tetrahydromethanopterin reductase-like flavin-dependent oxidoreductase (luciferase family)
VVRVDFGWRMPIWPVDQTPARVLVTQTENYLRQIGGAFQTVWIADHFEPANDWRGRDGDTLEGWSTLCHFAAAFPAFHYGHLVLANSWRMPSLLAKMAATTQLLTGGRLILGLGAGWMEREYRAYGYDFPSARTRIEQLDEALQVIRSLWTTSPASFEGRHYRLDNAVCNPRPDPPPPILIGGGGERFTLPVVARHADWWNFQGSTPEVYRHKLDVLAEHCAREGRDPGAITRTWENQCVAVAATRAEAQRIAEASPFFSNYPGEGNSLVGEPGDLAEHLQRYVELGVTHFILRFADFPSPNGAMLFMERVAPLLRAEALQ